MSIIAIPEFQKTECVTGLNEFGLRAPTFGLSVVVRDKVLPRLLSSITLDSVRKAVAKLYNSLSDYRESKIELIDGLEVVLNCPEVNTYVCTKASDFYTKAALAVQVSIFLNFVSVYCFKDSDYETEADARCRLLSLVDEAKQLLAHARNLLVEKRKVIEKLYSTPMLTEEEKELLQSTEDVRTLQRVREEHSDELEDSIFLNYAKWRNSAEGELTEIFQVSLLDEDMRICIDETVSITMGQ